MSRDDATRRLADPATRWLSKCGSRFIERVDLDLVEEAAHGLTGFVASPFPMSMPELYSVRDTSREELERNWKQQGEGYQSLCGLIARVKELTARAGDEFAPPVERYQGGPDGGATVCLNSPVKMTDGKGEAGKPPADPYADVRQFARTSLKGQERAVVEALCHAGGELPIADLTVREGICWNDAFQGFKDVQRRLNPKLKKLRPPWRLHRHHNAAFLSTR
jgi:hypothetical protein